MIDDFLDNFGLFDNFQPGKRFPFTNIGYDTNKNVYITIALAGYKKENINIKYENCVLTVEGSNEAEEDNLKYIQKHVSEGAFKRIINFARLYNDADISAKMEDGLLKILVKPKEQLSTPNYIKIS